jgi:hypothetical protein
MTDTIVRIDWNKAPGSARGIIIRDGVVREAAQGLQQFVGRTEAQAKAMIKANGYAAFITHPKTAKDYWVLGLTKPEDDAPLQNPISAG